MKTNQTMEYNKKKYLELKELEKFFQDQGKALHIEDYNSSVELVHQQAELSTYLFWQDRNNYASILKSYINGSNEIISEYHFISKFQDLWYKNINDFLDIRNNFDPSKLNFDPSQESIEFYELAEEIFWICEYFENDEDDETEFNNVWFKNSLKEVLLKMENYLN